MSAYLVHVVWWSVLLLKANNRLEIVLILKTFDILPVIFLDKLVRLSMLELCF